MSYCLIKDKNNISDINGYGSVDKNFLIQQSFISYEDYVSFLNSIGTSYKYYDLYNSSIEKIIEKNKSIFITKNIDPKQPISFIGLKQLKIYCNWLNTKNLKYLFTFPYNLESNTKHSENIEYWIPSYDEWYKATYYDSAKRKYWCFPNKSDSLNTENNMSPYGLINAGFVYYTILDNNQNISAPDHKYIISGGSNNRNPINAKSGTIYYVSENYYANYISARLCKKSDTKKFILKLYDTYGDGWGPNYLTINDNSNKILMDRITLADGYGPSDTIIEVDKVERNLNIRYHQNDRLGYENYYELYAFDNKELIYKSKMYEPPYKNILIQLLN